MGVADAQVIDLAFMLEGDPGDLVRLSAAALTGDEVECGICQMLSACARSSACASVNFIGLCPLE